MSKDDKSDPVASLRSFAITSGLHHSDQYNSLESQADEQVKLAFGECTSPVELPTPPTETKPQAIPFELSHPFGNNKVSLAHAINAWLTSALEADERVLLLGEDIGQFGGVHGVTRGLHVRFGDRSVVDTALNESAILGQAMGLALAGRRPIIEIQYRKYLDPAMEQFHNIGWTEWLTQGTFELPIIIRIPFGAGEQTDPWHAESNEATILRAIGYTVFCPSTANDAIRTFNFAYQSGHPTVILEHRGLYYSRLSRERLLPRDYSMESCTSRKSCDGQQMTVVSWGKLGREIAQALSRSDTLKSDMIELISLRDWDYATVAHSVQKTGRILIVHEDRMFMGLGAEIAATVSERLYSYLKYPVKRMGFKETPVPVSSELVRDSCPDVESIMAWIDAELHLKKIRRATRND